MASMAALTATAPTLPGRRCASEASFHSRPTGSHLGGGGGGVAARVAPAVPASGAANGGAADGAAGGRRRRRRPQHARARQRARARLSARRPARATRRARERHRTHYGGAGGSRPSDLGRAVESGASGASGGGVCLSRPTPLVTADVRRAPHREFGAERPQPSAPRAATATTTRSRVAASSSPLYEEALPLMLKLIYPNGRGEISQLLAARSAASDAYAMRRRCAGRAPRGVGSCVCA